ncbi:AMP-binding protein [Streptomyces hoynatensis]|uniref:AMP-dependent synthetase/ligase domain-containing protein n=1 Tax=Streptomyces hoynatensis TaxID=1141874 RepID=A0A3A9YZK1_9ACTN|nr:AMP-binding protein [Streptomyces hoynatensis]RKN41612.1 hypothetical protein D7294_14020 [Streptomyces hoynatensis]
MSGDSHGGGGDWTGPADVLSHTQLLTQGERAAQALSRLGVRPGEAVAVQLPMCLESVVATMACIQVGATRITLAPSGPVETIRARLNESGARVVVTANCCVLDGRIFPAKAALDRALTGCPDVHTVLVVPQLARPVPWTPGRDLWWHEALAAGSLPPRPYPGRVSSNENRSPEERRPEPGPAGIVFDDPLDGRSADDSDHGWGEPPAEEGGSGGLLRFLEEKPPHHL